MVTFKNLLAPVAQFERLVEEQHHASLEYKLTSEINDSATLKVETVTVDVKASAQTYIVMLLGILQQE
jgi:hypothetical protein